MPSFFRLLPAVTACALLSGCLMNSVQPLPTGGSASPWRAIIVFGMGVDLQQDARRVGVTLVKYNLERQTNAGNCLFFNRAEASIRTAPGAPLRYLAFDVPAGSYAFNSSSGSSLERKATAFIAPPGRTVYIGDFIRTGERAITLRRDLGAFELARKQALPNLKGEMLLAESRTVAYAQPFLCGV